MFHNGYLMYPKRFIPNDKSLAVSSASYIQAPLPLNQNSISVIELKHKIT